MLKNCPLKVHHHSYKTFFTLKQLPRQVHNIPYKEHLNVWLYNYLKVKNLRLEPAIQPFTFFHIHTVQGLWCSSLTEDISGYPAIKAKKCFAFLSLRVNGFPQYLLYGILKYFCSSTILGYLSTASQCFL